MNVKELLEYREFDRESKPAPRIPFVQSYTVEEVTEWVKTNGIAKPLELSIWDNKALLTDGNHRIVSADKLAYKTVPVKVTFYDTKEELDGMFYEHTIQRFKLVA